MYRIVVIVDRKLGKVIGAGSVILERKFIHELGKVAHVEDIVVQSGYRGKNLG